jgi:hypothetical protein
MEEGITNPLWDSILMISKILEIEGTKLIHVENNILKIHYEEKIDSMNKLIANELVIVNNK